MRIFISGHTSGIGKYLYDNLDYFLYIYILETKTHEIEKIDTENKIIIFKYLASQFFDKLKNYSENSNKSLAKLQELVDSQ